MAGSLCCRPSSESPNGLALLSAWLKTPPLCLVFIRHSVPSQTDLIVRKIPKKLAQVIDLSGNKAGSHPKCCISAVNFI